MEHEDLYTHLHKSFSKMTMRNTRRGWFEFRVKRGQLNLKHERLQNSSDCIPFYCANFQEDSKQIQQALSNILQDKMFFYLQVAELLRGS